MIAMNTYVPDFSNRYSDVRAPDVCSIVQLKSHYIWSSSNYALFKMKLSYNQCTNEVDNDNKLLHTYRPSLQ